MAHRRTDEQWVRSRLAEAASRAVLATEGGVLMLGSAPALVPLEGVLDGTEPVLLGMDDAGAVFAVDPGPERAAEAAPGAVLRDLRDVAAQATRADGGLVAHAAALLNWHRTHRHCARCGAATISAEAGHVRACTACGALHHPRTDPVVIMLVHDGDRLLLGRQRRWPERMYSTLAGFVEPGETPEEAVVREVHEESGVDVVHPTYRGSQPWPFPTSLMLGFDAAYAGGVATAKDGELEDVRWLGRDEVARAAADDGEVALPPRLSIARSLVEGWLDRRRSPDAPAPVSR